MLFEVSFSDISGSDDTVCGFAPDASAREESTVVAQHSKAKLSVSELNCLIERATVSDGVTPLESWSAMTAAEEELERNGSDRAIESLDLVRKIQETPF